MSIPPLTSQVKENLLSDLNERKIVKTISLKKVSAVAVASLGLGLLSVVPAQAAVTLPLWVDTATTVGGVAITADTATVTRTLNTQVAAAAVKTITASAGEEIIFVVKSAGTFTTSSIIDMSIDGTVVQTQTTLGTNATVATTARNLPSVTKSTTFIYNLRVYETADTRLAATTTVDLPVSITVVPRTGYSNTLSTAFINYGAAATAPTSATTAEQGSVTAAKGTANSANINLLMKNASGADYLTGASVSAEISGPGYLRWVDEANDAANCAVDPAYDANIGRSLAARAVDAQSSLYVCADGTSGVATVTIKVTDADDSVYTLATRSLTFFGSVTKIAATGVLTIGRSAGAALGVDTAARTAGVTPSIIVKATDKNDVGVSGLTFTLKSSNVNVMTETLTCNEDIKATANVASSGGKGFYNCATTSSSGSKSGDKADLTVRIVDPAGDGTTFLTSVVAFTIGGSAATGTETLAFDKTSYAPGEAMVITRTGKDSSGNSVSDGTASPELKFSKAVGGTAPIAGTYVGGASKSSTSAATAGVFAPVTPGAFTVIATAANGTTITASATVTDANAGLLTQLDALNAKIVALNALIAKIMKKLGVK
jgi:hypothetical protein